MAVGRDLRGGDETHRLSSQATPRSPAESVTKRSTTSRAHTKRFIVVLNDNEWSIAKNVGAIASYLNTIATSPTYAHLHEKARQFVETVAGKSARSLRTKSRRASKA